MPDHKEPRRYNQWNSRRGSGTRGYASRPKDSNRSSKFTDFPLIPPQTPPLLGSSSQSATSDPLPSPSFGASSSKAPGEPSETEKDGAVSKKL
jgi:hypothetical protein